jgi:hypothetical protein
VVSVYQMANSTATVATPIERLRRLLFWSVIHGSQQNERWPRDRAHGARHTPKVSMPLERNVPFGERRRPTA